MDRLIDVPPTGIPLSLPCLSPINPSIDQIVVAIKLMDHRSTSFDGARSSLCSFCPPAPASPRPARRRSHRQSVQPLSPLARSTSQHSHPHRPAFSSQPLTLSYSVQLSSTSHTPAHTRYNQHTKLTSSHIPSTRSSHTSKPSKAGPNQSIDLD